MTSYGRNKNHDDEIKKNKRRPIIAPAITVRLLKAGRLPENSRNRFVDRKSKKNSKKDRPKKFVFSLKADLLYFD